MLRRSQIMCALALLAALGCNQEPADTPLAPTPQYRDIAPGEPSSGERGSMMITEIGWAGSVRDDGSWDPDDTFLELQNRGPRPINVSQWRLIISGDVVRTVQLGTIPDPIEPNDFFVIVAKADGAWAPSADLILDGMRFGRTYVHIELRDADRRLMESAGSDSERVFTGGYDTYAVRSMERVQQIFGNRGDASRAWHAYSDDEGLASGVAQGWRERSLASPGAASSRDYSGSVSAGGFN